MKFDQLEVCGTVFTEHSPSWINQGLSSSDFYEKLLPLLDFYVFENPNLELSSRAVPLNAYGWCDPWKKPTYLNRKLKDKSNNKYLYYSACKLPDMEAALRKAGLLNQDILFEKELACFYDNKSNQTMSCLYHLRNSFCHGRFAFFQG